MNVRRENPVYLYSGST